MAPTCVACQADVPSDDYGLNTVVVMSIDSEALSVLRTGSYTKSPVVAPVWINGQAYRAQVSYAGATSVDDLKRSFSLQLSSAFRGRTAYRLNAMNRDPSALHALLAYRAFEELGFEMPSLDPAAVWLNGEYAGLFLLQELYDRAYFEGRGAAPVVLYQAKRASGTLDCDTATDAGFAVRVGSEQSADLAGLVGILADVPTASNWAKLDGLVDISQVLRYMAVSSFIDNTDGIDNNYFLVRTQQQPRFRVLPWDLDRTFSESHREGDGTLFVNNVLMSRLFQGRSRLGSVYHDYLCGLRDVAILDLLSDFVWCKAAVLEEAYVNDPFLVAAGVSFWTHVEQLTQAIRTQAALAEKDGCADGTPEGALLLGSAYDVVGRQPWSQREDRLNNRVPELREEKSRHWSLSRLVNIPPPCKYVLP